MEEGLMGDWWGRERADGGGLMGKEPVEKPEKDERRQQAQQRGRRRVEMGLRGREGGVDVDFGCYGRGAKGHEAFGENGGR